MGESWLPPRVHLRSSVPSADSSTLLEVQVWGAGLGSWTLSSGGESRAGGFEIIETRVLGPTLVQPLGQAMQARWAHFPIPKRSSCCLPFVCKN